MIFFSVKKLCKALNAILRTYSMLHECCIFLYHFSTQGYFKTYRVLTDWSKAINLVWGLNPAPFPELHMSLVM